MFKGIYTALITPFKDSKTDFDALGTLIDRQIKAGVEGFVLLGTTAETPALSFEEKKEILDFACTHIGKRAKIVIGAGSNNTQTTLKNIELASRYNPNGLLIVTPYYNKCTPEGMVSHFTAAADATDLPMILYNVPSRTAMNITPEIAQRMAEHKNIAAIKEASGNIAQIAETARLTRGKLTIYSGNDDHIVPVLSLGGKGVISVLANVAPRYTHELVAAYLAGETQKAT